MAVRHPGRRVRNSRKAYLQKESRFNLPEYRHSLLDDPYYLRFLLNKSNPVIFEIGCNDGSDSIKLLNLTPNTTLHCFEPEPRAIEQFKKKLEREKNYHLYEVAVGEENKTATFHQSTGHKEEAYKKDWDLSGSLNQPTGHKKYSPWVKFRDQIDVSVRTLDSFSELAPSIDLLWMDVQGGEQNVMKGGNQVLSKTHYVYTEFGHWKEPLYLGQMNLDETIDEFGTDWHPIAVFEGMNLLLINTKYEQSTNISVHPDV